MRLILGLIFSVLAFAQYGTISYPFRGFDPSSGGSPNGLNINANDQAVSLVLPAAKTLSSVRFYTSGITGSPAQANVVMTLEADSGTIPSGSATATITGCDVAPSAAAFLTCSFASGQSLAAQTTYWLRQHNANATPASNYWSVRYIVDQPGLSMFGNGGASWGSRQASTTTFSTGVKYAPWAGLRLNFSDGTYAGNPFLTVGSIGTSGVYSTRKYGMQFTAPKGLRVKGVSALVFKTGTPSAAVRIEIYNGTTLLGASQWVPAASILTTTTAAEQEFYFSSDVYIPLGATTRVVLAEDTNADANTSRYETRYLTIDTDANSLPLLPFGGTLAQVIYDGSTWTTTQTQAPFFTLLLDAAQPFYQVTAHASAN